MKTLPEIYQTLLKEKVNIDCTVELLGESVVKFITESTSDAMFFMIDLGYMPKDSGIGWISFDLDD